MFAMVITHTVAHGYHMFIKGPCEEPLWDLNETHSELGLL